MTDAQDKFKSHRFSECSKQVILLCVKPDLNETIRFTRICVCACIVVLKSFCVVTYHRAGGRIPSDGAVHVTP